MCSLRIACNTRRKNQSTGEWEDKPNDFNVTVRGAQGERRPLPLKGAPGGNRRAPGVARVGAQDGTKRQATDIIADSVQFLGSRDDAAGGGAFTGSAAPQGSDVPVDGGDFQPAPVAGGTGEDDIPF